MTLKELSKLVGDGLYVGVNISGRWYLHFAHGDIKEPGVLVGSWGGGNTLQEAAESYCKEIRGKRLVINAQRTGWERKEYDVPLSLVAE